jgi:hypothetical protein
LLDQNGGYSVPYKQAVDVQTFIDQWPVPDDYAGDSQLFQITRNYYVRFSQKLTQLAVEEGILSGRRSSLEEGCVLRSAQQQGRAGSNWGSQFGIPAKAGDGYFGPADLEHPSSPAYSGVVEIVNDVSDLHVWTR